MSDAIEWLQIIRQARKGVNELDKALAMLEAKLGGNSIVNPSDISGIDLSTVGLNKPEIVNENQSEDGQEQTLLADNVSEEYEKDFAQNDEPELPEQGKVNFSLGADEGTKMEIKETVIKKKASSGETEAVSRTLKSLNSNMKNDMESLFEEE